MLQALDATQVRRWAVACVQALDAHREAIDSINVYPVPDGDTGSNLLHTMRAALDALLRAPARTRASAAAAMAVLARGALAGARGNSGVITSQFLRGVAEALTSPGTAQPSTAAALTSAGAGQPGAGMAHPGTDTGLAQSGADAGPTQSGADAGPARPGAGAGPAGTDTALATAGAGHADAGAGLANPAQGGETQAGTDPTQPSTGAESAGAETGPPGAGMVQPSTGAAQAGTGVTEALISADPVQPATGTVQSSSGAALAGPGAGQTGADPAQPSTSAALAGADAGQPGTGAALAGADAGQPGTGAALASTGAAQAATDLSQFSPGAALADADASQAGADRAQPSTGAALAGADTGQPGIAAAEAGADAVPPGVDAALPGGGAAQSATDPAPGGADAVLGPGLRAALVRGAELARAAMAEPVLGTMVTVFEAAATAAGAETSDALQDVAAAAATAAAAALDETPSQLAALADAGVVDAGGRGVVVLFDALYAVVTGQPAALAAAQRANAEQATRPSAGVQESSLYTSRESGSDAFAYEVMYLLEQVVGDGGVDHLRDVLVGLGDSVSVVGDGAGLWTVHVHCNDIGAAIEAGIDAGRPRQIRVARFADAPSPEASRFTRDRAVVVPARSTEFADLLISEGVTVVQVEDGHDESLAHRLLETITRTAAAHVTVLPADPGLVEAADEASIRAVAAGQDVVVVPCASPVQVLAAVAVHDPRRRAGDDVVAMAEAAAATRRGEVVVATEAAITWIGACDAGDVLGFADGEVMLIEPGPADVAALDRAACGVVKRMLAVGGELVTALLGADAPDELAMELEDFLRREHPETELVVYQGGQHNAVLVLGVE